MSKNKELVAEAIAAIPLWIAFLDKKEAEQNALLEEMQGKKKETFIGKIASRFKKKKEKSLDSNALPLDESLDGNTLPLNESLDSNSETPSKVRLEKEESLDNVERWAPKTTEYHEEEKEEKEEEKIEEEQEEEEEVEEEQLKNFV